MTASTAKAVLAGLRPSDVTVANDYPTEFSAGVASRIGASSPLGPFCVHLGGDDLVVGEIGGGSVQEGTVEIGYAIVTSRWGQGCATNAVIALIARARCVPGVRRLVAHTPLDRPASGRVLEKAGFAWT